MSSQYSPSSFDEAYSDKSSSNKNNNPSSTDTLIQTLQSVESLESQQLFETAPYSNSQNQLLFPARSQNLLYADCLDFDLSRTHVEELPRSSLASKFYLVSAPPLTETDKSRMMSALALQYDNNFSMGSRSSFTWPVLDSGSGLISPEFGSYGSDSSFAGSRSGTASPPRTSLSAEQRELKRQRDQARRDSKMHIRGRRAGSSSSSGVYSPPPSLAVMSSGAPGMPIYTSAGPVSLLAETHTTRYHAQFSPPLSDHHNTQSNMYHNSYPTPTYINDYGYPASATPGLPSYYGRQMSDPNLMYPVSPPAMGDSPQDTAGQIDQGQLPETDNTSEPSADEQDEGRGETREYVPWYGMEQATPPREASRQDLRPAYVHSGSHSGRRQQVHTHITGSGTRQAGGRPA
ncbi:uncharacterized protein B0T23DRAFT_402800 [Neurospora hispaniola]|uniref:Uncharacterized protein n=1 Tax=Neurospora hispaniola TaxID=588809 RepID=A0AAJ0MUK9_9PEZI|nr:hypothetical protein B0T23DRAFT_402800 [Neurospora hispaniola]